MLTAMRKGAQSWIGKVVPGIIAVTFVIAFGVVGNLTNPKEVLVKVDSHEIMVSDEESDRAVDRGRWYAILPMLPEVCGDRVGDGSLQGEYSSRHPVMSPQEILELLKRHKLMLEDVPVSEGEVLR